MISDIQCWTIYWCPAMGTQMPLIKSLVVLLLHSINLSNFLHLSIATAKFDTSQRCIAASLTAGMDLIYSREMQETYCGRRRDG